MTIHSNIKSASPSLVVATFLTWRERYAWANSGIHRDMGEEEFDAVCDKLKALRNAVLALPSESAADTLAKLVAFTENGSDVLVGGVDNADEFAAEVAAVIDKYVLREEAAKPTDQEKPNKRPTPVEDIDDLEQRFAECRETLDMVDFALGDIRNIACALDILTWEFVQQEIEQDTHLEHIRSAICALNDALNGRVRQYERERFKEEV